MPQNITPYNLYASLLRGDSPSFSDMDGSSSEETLWRTGLENGVLALASHRLTNSMVLESYPQSYREKLQQHSLNAAATEMLRQDDLNTTLELFTQADIPFLLMKGTPLAYSLYPAPYLRERSDTDILFSNKKNSEAAWRVLEKLGYQRRNTTEGEFVGYQFSCTREVGQGFTQTLDIHNKLNDYQFFANTFGFDELYEKSVVVRAVSESSRAFHRIHALLHACMHRVAHIPHGEENRLIWLYDIHLLANTFSKEEWCQVCELAKEKGIAGVCLNSLLTTQQSLHTQIDQVHLDSLDTSAKKEKISPHEKGKRWEFYYLAFKSTPGLANKLKQLRDHLFPSIDYMMKKYQTKSKLKLPYLYVYRVVKGIKRYF